MTSPSDPPEPGQPTRARGTLTTEQLKLARASLPARAPVGAAELAAVQARAAERAAEAAPHRNRPFLAVLRQVSGEARADNVKIHEADLPHRIIAPPLSGSMKSDTRRRILEARRPGDPLPANIESVYDRLYGYTEGGRLGYCRPTHQMLAAATGLCVDTVRRCLRFLQELDVIDIANTIVRHVVDGYRRLVRGANVYFLRRLSQATDTDAKPKPDTQATVPTVPTVPSFRERAIGRWGRILGLAPSITGRGLQRPPAPA
jgi:hypothetical protein